MLTNCVLKRIDVAGAADVGGNVPYTTGSPIAVRVAFDQPTTSQKWIQGASVKDAKAALYVQAGPGADPAVAAIKIGDRVSVCPDFADTDFTYQVIGTEPRIFRAVSHVVIYLGIIV